MIIDPALNILYLWRNVIFGQLVLEKKQNNVGLMDLFNQWKVV